MLCKYHITPHNFRVCAWLKSPNPEIVRGHMLFMYLFSDNCPNPVLPISRIFWQQCIRIRCIEIAILQNGKVWSSWRQVLVQNSSNLSTLTFLILLTTLADTLSIISRMLRLGASSPSVLKRLMTACRISGPRIRRAKFAVSVLPPKKNNTLKL